MASGISASRSWWRCPPPMWPAASSSASAAWCVAASATSLRLPLRSTRLANSVALVGSESLLGREVRDIVATAPPAFDLRLIAADEEEPGRLTRVGDEPIALAALSTESLVDAQAVVLAGSAAANRKALEIVTGADTGPSIVHLTYIAEGRP